MYYQFIPDRNALQTTRNLQYVKGYFAKPLTLVCALLKLIAVVASVILGFLCATLDFSSYINYIITSFNPSVSISGGYVSYNLFAILSSVVVLGVVVFAFVFGYIKSRNQDEKASPMASVIIFRVLSIIGVVGMAALAAVYAISAAGTLVALWAVDIGDKIAVYFPIDIQSFTIAITVGLSIVGVGVILLLIQSISQLRFVNSVRRSISSPQLVAKGATPYSVLTVFSAVASACTVVFCLILAFSDYSKYMDAPQFASLNFSQLKTVLLVSAITSCLSFAYEIALVALAMGYRRHIASADGDGVYLPADYSAPVQPAHINTPQADRAQQAGTNPGELRHAANPATPAGGAAVLPVKQPVKPEPVADSEPAPEPGIQVEPQPEASASEPFAQENQTVTPDNAQPQVTPDGPAPLPEYPCDMVPPAPKAYSELDENVYAPVTAPAPLAQPAETPVAPQQAPPADATTTASSFCSQCGCRLAPESRFCSNCGNRIN